ncbi:exodeoxyribonuclease VII large subunit [Sulfobacillus acidophilus]|uniref:Exodeoxyribonuclease 7 large subunit n=1 Tax=Sulfobacillus acidophilus TaxID=53633 RepID=A0ABS3B0N8_9FIRM|nr:exodeoxyribonuclease VII large subunit [Sulfobacillus acidophilus]
MTALSNEMGPLFSQIAKTDQKSNVLLVSDLVLNVKKIVEKGFANVAVIGEISSFKCWRSGHWYFDLKDKKAVLPAVMFRFLCQKVKFEPKDGMQVILHGKVSLYAAQSKIQIVVNNIEPVGKGALALAFEQLKEKLAKEGLFAAVNKKALPAFPKTIGLVTSPQGAVLRDMLKILKQRMPKCSVLLAPAKVQGKTAARDIAQAIKNIDESGFVDAIIVGRGGGSLEDLWAFNEEEVARAIFACKTPIISAVGHETDFSIADFVADLRAATPTHAAQIVVPNILDIQNALSVQLKNLGSALKKPLLHAYLLLQRAALSLKDPQLLLMPHVQRLKNTQAKLDETIFLKIEAKKRDLQVLMAKLWALSPLLVLGRGYALALKDQQVVRSVKDVQKGNEISIRLTDGSILAKVKDISYGKHF